jgi:hypothetical protein
VANEWYVQHGGKQYGPLTSANLKKLATDGKIVPATSVRLGSDGAWVPASRVQGLFAAAPPVAPPPPPPMANPLARMPVGRVAPSPQAVAVDGGAMAAKIVGAVALILGILALATFWLPTAMPAGGGAMGWTGIVVGGLGLLLAIGGLVLAAMHRGSGLYLNIAAGGSSVVGLVLTVVLGSMFGLFGSPPKQVAVIPKPLPPVQAAPLPHAPPPRQPEPEPQWTDASQSSIQQGNVKASIVSAKVENVRLESGDLSRLAKQKSQPMLKIVVTIENTAKDKIIEVPLWHGGGGDLPAGLGDLVGGELGKAVTSASASATLTDNFGNPYKQTPTMMLFGNTVTVGKDNAVRPGKSAAGDLVFPPPLDTIEYLRLELSPGGFGGDEPLRFQIPKAMIAGP